MWGVAFGVWGVGFKASGGRTSSRSGWPTSLILLVQGPGSGDWESWSGGFGFEVWGSVFEVWCSGVWSLGFAVEGWGLGSWGLGQEFGGWDCW